MIVYEKMNNTHIAAIAQLERENFSMPWSESVLLSELSRPLSLWLVAIKENEVVGYVGAQIVPDEADMMNIAVSSSCRRIGIGRQLVIRLIAELQQQGVRSLSLEVRASNSPAISLYTELGFEVVGRRPGYYKMPKEDALIMRKEWQL